MYDSTTRAAPAILVILWLSRLLPAAGAEGPVYDLLLKGGHVIDPANGVDAPRDVALTDGKVAAVAKDIPPAVAARSRP